MSIPDLIALKLTRRLADYDVISNLVRARLTEVESPDSGLLHWAATYSFRAEDRVEFTRLLGADVSEESCRKTILDEIADFQAADAVYWARIVDDLRRLRRQNRLLPEGTAVSDLAHRRYA